MGLSQRFRKGVGGRYLWKLFIQLFWHGVPFWVHSGHSETGANANANSDAPRHFASECLPPNLKQKAANEGLRWDPKRPFTGPSGPQMPKRSQKSLPMPKGLFRTKNSTALESVVFCYGCSSSLSVPFSCLLLLRKRSISEPYGRSILLRPCRNFSPYRNSLSVVFLVREGPLGVQKVSETLEKVKNQGKTKGQQLKGKIVS